VRYKFVADIGNIEFKLYRNLLWIAISSQIDRDHLVLSGINWLHKEFCNRHWSIACGQESRNHLIEVRKNVGIGLGQGSVGIVIHCSCPGNTL
jgi:hypothetical protein